MASTPLLRYDLENKQRIIAAIRRSGRVVSVSVVPPDVRADWANAEPAIFDPASYGHVPVPESICASNSRCVAVLEFGCPRHSQLFATTRGSDFFRWFTFMRGKGKMRWNGGGHKVRGPRASVMFLKDGEDEFLTMVHSESRDVSDALARRLRAFRFPFNFLSTPKDGIIERSNGDASAIIEEFFRFRVFRC